MPARNVHEVNITNWTSLGSTAPVDRYSFDLEIKWTDMAGVFHTHSGTYIFPNDIVSMPLVNMRHFAEMMVLAMVRTTLGIDTWDEYT